MRRVVSILIGSSALSRLVCLGHHITTANNCVARFTCGNPERTAGSRKVVSGVGGAGMDIQDMRIFARVAAVQNLSAVGTELGLTPGTISKRIQSLEDE